MNITLWSKRIKIKFLELHDKSISQTTKGHHIHHIHWKKQKDNVDHFHNHAFKLIYICTFFTNPHP